jgi:hypothetical protein
MNIPKIEESITLLYQTFIEDQDVATQRGIAITAMNEMVRLLGGVNVVAKIESVPYSARLRTQYLFEDNPPQRTWVGLTNNELQRIADAYRIFFGSWVEEFAREIEAKLKERNG